MSRLGGAGMRGAGSLMGGAGAASGAGKGLLGAARAVSKGGIGGLTHAVGRGMSHAGKALPGWGQRAGDALGRFATQSPVGRALNTGLGATGLGLGGYALGRSGIPSQMARQAFGPMPWDANSGGAPQPRQPQQPQQPPQRTNTPSYYGR